jgi:hypothetical protein
MSCIYDISLKDTASSGSTKTSVNMFYINIDEPFVIVPDISTSGSNYEFD